MPQFRGEDSYRITSTEHGEYVTILDATLSSKALLTPDLPLVPTTIRYAYVNEFLSLSVCVSPSYLDTGISICGICILFNPVIAPTIPASTLGTAVMTLTCKRVAYMLGKMSPIDRLG
jgi:hypothetical protein